MNTKLFIGHVKIQCGEYEFHSHSFIRAVDLACAEKQLREVYALGNEEIEDGVFEDDLGERIYKIGKIQEVNSLEEAARIIGTI